MPQSLTRLLIHIVFSTKHRADLITPEIDADLHAYLGGICRGLKSPAIIINGTGNHVHLLVNLSRTIALSDLVMNVKKDSSKWVKTKGVGTFGWQDGYGAFSIGESSVAALSRYIRDQKKRHASRSFEDELRALCRKYKVAFDEAYMWD